MFQTTNQFYMLENIRYNHIQTVQVQVMTIYILYIYNPAFMPIKKCITIIAPLWLFNIDSWKPNILFSMWFYLPKMMVFHSYGSEITKGISR